MRLAKLKLENTTERRPWFWTGCVYTIYYELSKGINERPNGSRPTIWWHSCGSTRH